MGKNSIWQPHSPPLLKSWIHPCVPGHGTSNCYTPQYGLYTALGHGYRDLYLSIHAFNLNLFAYSYHIAERGKLVFCRFHKIIYMLRKQFCSQQFRDWCLPVYMSPYHAHKNFCGLFWPMKGAKIFPQISHYHYTNLTFVCPCVRAWEREVTGSHSTCTKKILLLWIARVGRYTKEPTDTTSNDTRPGLKEKLCNSAGRSTLTCGGLETANERDSGVEVVRGCLTEGGDSILRVFPWELLKLK